MTSLDPSLDKFEVKKLYPTASRGREWFAGWGNERLVSKYSYDPGDPLMRNEDGELRIGGGIASIKAGLTRLVVLTPKSAAGQPPLAEWKNVEMTAYVKRGKSSQAPSYQAFYLSARSGERHNDDVPCQGTSYHFTARFDGKVGFKKEIWHTGGYTELRPAQKLWDTVPEGRWIGIKFICRNLHQDNQVRLEAYVDFNETNEWKLVAEYIDEGGWRGEREGCDRRLDEILTMARPAVYFRTDYVDVELKKFSVREIDGLP